MTNAPRRWLLLVALSLVPALGACNRDDAAEDDVDVTPGTEVAPTQAIRVSEVELGSSIGADNRVNDNATTDEFRPTDTIYASVNTEGTGSGTLRARWTFHDGQVVSEDSRTISPSGPTVTEFHISKPDGFPVGQYKVEIQLNGETVESKDFEVKAAG